MYNSKQYEIESPYEEGVLFTYDVNKYTYTMHNTVDVYTYNPKNKHWVYGNKYFIDNELAEVAYHLAVEYTHTIDYILDNLDINVW